MVFFQPISWCLDVSSHNENDPSNICNLQIFHFLHILAQDHQKEQPMRYQPKSSEKINYRMLHSGVNEYLISQVRVTASIKSSSASRICEYIVLNINIFNVEYDAIIEIVESGRVDKKISSRICEYRSTRPLPKCLYVHI